jgi:hypothetical protein
VRETRDGTWECRDRRSRRVVVVAVAGAGTWQTADRRRASVSLSSKQDYAAALHYTTGTASTPTLPILCTWSCADQSNTSESTGPNLHEHSLDRYKQSAVPQLWCGSDTCGKTPGPKLQPEPARDMLRDSDTDVTAIGQGRRAELKPSLCVKQYSNDPACDGMARWDGMGWDDGTAAAAAAAAMRYVRCPD